MIDVDHVVKRMKEASETKWCLEDKDKNGCYLEVRDYDPIWKDGEVICKTCGKFVCYFDAG